MSVAVIESGMAWPAGQLAMLDGIIHTHDLRRLKGGTAAARIRCPLRRGRGVGATASGVSVNPKRDKALNKDVSQGNEVSIFDVYFNATFAAR
jgi:hypothetical protein